MESMIQKAQRISTATVPPESVPFQDDGYDYEQINIEADVIVTATVLGFIGTRYHQNQPCRFDYEHPSPEKFRIWEAIFQLNDATQENNSNPKEKEEGYQYTHEYVEGIKELLLANEKADKRKADKGKSTKGKLAKKKLSRRFKNKNKVEASMPKTSVSKQKIELLTEIWRNLFEIIELFDKHFYSQHLLQNNQKDPKTDERIRRYIYLAKQLIVLLDNEPRPSERKIQQNNKIAKINYLTEQVETKIKDFNKYISKYNDFLSTLGAMTLVLDRTDEKIGKHLEDSQSPAWKPGALITGLEGGAGVDFGDRHRQINPPAAKGLAEDIASHPKEFPEIYRGRGAYTGMIDNPEDKRDDTPENRKDVFVRPTRRVIYTGRDRWHPGGKKHRNSNRWGLISPEKKPDLNLNPNKAIGMGPFPSNSKELLEKNPGVIGYIHGMSSAICECLEKGPWCTPFEMAIGTDTTKMASCFGCCTYMYAAGYPPSSMHLGRSESWVPPSPRQVNGEVTGGTGKYATKEVNIEFKPEIVSFTLSKWEREVSSYMRLGAKYLDQAQKALTREDKKKQVKYLEDILRKNPMPKYFNREKEGGVPLTTRSIDDLLSPAHQKEATKLHNLFNLPSSTNPKIGANLYLDALTVHKPDWQRIADTLFPIFNAITKRKLFLSRKREELVTTKSLSPDYNTSFSASTLPTMASTDEPVLLNGMKVIFNESASAYPVTLTQDD